MPLVSIVMPVYNGAAWLAPCLDAVLSQTMGDFELIVVDDASTDETPRILASTAARDGRVTVLTNAQNLHAGAARNAGMERAHGTYLLFLDADDLFEPTLLERAVDAARACDADVCLFGADVFVGTDIAHRRADPYLLDRALVPAAQPFNRDSLPERLFQLCTPEPWSKLFRRSFIEGLGLRFQDMQNANDLFFTMAAMAQAQRIVAVLDILVHHRTGVAGTVQARKAQEPLAFLDALRALRAYLAEHGLLAQLETSFANLAVFHCLYNAAAPADWPRVFLELGVAGHPREDFYLPGDYGRYTGLVLDAWDASHDELGYGIEFWRGAALAANERARAAEEELARVKGSASFKVGLKVTWLPRKLRELLGCGER